MQQEASPRQDWMRILALAPWADLASRAASLADISCDMIRPPETGLVMLRGRIGGSGAAFNLGEATVTRCTVRTPKGHEGYAYVMGRNRDHARIAAICDALLQDCDRRDEISRAVIEPLRVGLNEKRNLAARKAAATKVDFFTLARGDND
jgi:alpha-D-ribose 1-methylphosphonate 5-triphosphate synthase subunit PhnG